MMADIRGVSFMKPPVDLIKVFKFLQIKYLCRLYVLYVYGMNAILNFCWNLIKGIVDEGTAKKFVFITSENTGVPFSHVNKEQLEDKFGGKAKNIPDYLDIPFLLPSSNYLLEKKEGIITEEEYIQLAKEKKLCVMSPYLKDIEMSKEEKNEKPFNNIKEDDNEKSSATYISDKDVQNNVTSKQNGNKEKMRTIFETKEENEACCSFNGCQCIII